MCHWCDPDAEMPVYTDDDPDNKKFHDMWLFPHGRYGYTPVERIQESLRQCPWCILASSYPNIPPGFITEVP